MANNPEKALLEWMALKPRTLEWGAVIAYDRSKCNTLLIQEYINKFDSNAYMPPINKSVATGTEIWEHLYDWINDVPRLSFEESSDAPGGQVNMKMAMVGGTQITIDSTMGVKRAIKVESLDALDAPELVAKKVLLKESKGSINSAGEVLLNLADPETAAGTWELNFASTQHERRIGGEFFKKYFRSFTGDEAERSIYHLGQIAFTDQQYLKPKSFKLRTVTAPGAQSRTSENHGDGAVELFVCMEGELEGNMPGEDWKYLIPDDMPGKYSCTTLIGNGLFMSKILTQGAKHLCNTDVDFLIEETEDGFIRRLVAKPSIVTQPFHMSVFRGGDEYTFNLVQRYLPMASSTPFSISIGKGTANQNLLFIKWAGREQRSFTSTDNWGDHTRYSHSAWLNWSYEATWEVKVDLDEQSITIEPSREHAVTVSLEAINITDDKVRRDFREISEFYNWQANLFMSVDFREMFIKAPDISFYVLNSILFDSSDAVQLDTAHLLGDFVFFGQISPRLTTFSITPLESLMGHGATQQLGTVPARTGLKWTVENVPGSAGHPGLIDENSGLYTSPPLSDIPGTFTRVKVTATDPLNKYSSSALVTVVTRDITVNPLVQICNASTDIPQTRELSANTLGDGNLEWSVIKGTGSIPKTARPNRENTYTAGPKDISIDESFTLDEIQVKNLKTLKTQSSYVLVNHQPADLQVTTDMEQSSFPQGKAQLVAFRRGKLVKGIVWKVIAGSGSIDTEGLYTADPNGQHRFALITALKNDEDGYFMFDGFIILALPLIELPDKPAELLDV